MLHVLASGSSGNAYCIETPSELIFVDMGVTLGTAKSFIEIPERRDKKISMLVTHEHSDHVKGLGAFLNNYPVNVYSSAGTIAELCNMGIDEKLCNSMQHGAYYDFDSYCVRPFSVSHDAVQPFGYVIMCEAGNVGLMTDLGCATRDQLEILQYAHMLVLESNYDKQLLKDSNYPAFLKKRISSMKGHLSNNDAMRVLAELHGGCLRKCLLAHVSEENNDYNLLETLARFGEKQYNISVEVLRQKSSYSHSISSVMEMNSVAY